MSSSGKAVDSQPADWNAEAFELNARGVRLLRENRPGESVGLFERAIASDPASPELYLNLAKAHRLVGNDAGEQAALEGALAQDQRHVMALVRIAELWERRGDLARAAERWAALLSLSASIEDLTPPFLELLDHARDVVGRHQAGFLSALDAALAPGRARAAPAERRRFEACLDHMLGRRRIYANEPHGLHYPFLPADEFFDRDHFDWMPALEAQTAIIRGELSDRLAARAVAPSPYVSMPPGTPPNAWTALNDKEDWSAVHLWRNGTRDDAVCARFPQTAAIVESLPLMRLPGHAPNIFFSILKPGASLPPHTGVTNARAIVHLALIVPPGCGFRVGGETRAWREGEAFAFDDTIEHEAWNRSDRMRAILIFEVWNPYLSETERSLVSEYFRVADLSGFSPDSAKERPH